MLARLTSRGAVIKELGQSRTAIYVAAERLFNIYFLMRRHSHPSSRVRALVTFMMAYYDSDELVDTTALLMREACGFEPAQRGDYHSTFDAIMSYSSEAVRDQILARTSPDFIRSFRDDKSASQELASYLPRDSSEDEQYATIQALIKRIEKVGDEGDLDTIYDLLIESIQRNSQLFQLWIQLSVLELRRGNVSAAIMAGEKARELKPSDPWSHAILGQALALAGRTDEAEASCLVATERDPGQSLALTTLASIWELPRGLGVGTRTFRCCARRLKHSPISLVTHTENFWSESGGKAEVESILREGAYEFENDLSRHALVEFLEAQGATGRRNPVP